MLGRWVDDGVEGYRCRAEEDPQDYSTPRCYFFRAWDLRELCTDQEGGRAIHGLLGMSHILRRLLLSMIEVRVFTVINLIFGTEDVGE